MTHCRLISWIVALALLSTLAGCPDDASSPPTPPSRSGTSTPDGAPDIERLAQAARLETYRSEIPDRVAEVCARYSEPDVTGQDGCPSAATAYFEAIALEIESAPVAWEESLFAVAETCLRGAYQRAKSEVEGKTERMLLIEGLREAPACLARQRSAMAERAEQSSKR